MLEELRPGLLGRRGERLPMLGGLGLVLVAATVIVTASLRDPRSLDDLEHAAGPEMGSAAPQGAGSTAAPGGSSISVTAGPSLAPSAVLEHATSPDDLEKLTATYPSDPNVERKLLAAYADDQHELPHAVPAALKLLSIMPGAAQDELVRRVILRGASGPPAIADMAFGAMQSGMGADGPDLLWELAEGGTNVATAVKDRATKALADPAVRELMSPALRVACDLKGLQACQRKTLLTSAEKDGDKRSIPLLEALVAQHPCGLLHLSSCYACPGSPAAGLQAIAAIKARSTKP